MQDRSHDAVVSAQFSAHADAYLRSAVHAGGEDLSRLATIVGRLPPGSALDLGCGGGHVAYLLAPLMREVTAFDLSDAMLATVQAEAARRGLANLATRQGSVDNLPWPDQSFDLVVSRYSAHHWHNMAAGLREACRVLKPGGLAVFMDVVAPPSPLLDTWLQALELLRDPSHLRDYSVAEWRSLLDEAGFRRGETAHFQLRLDFKSWVQRMQTPDIQVAAIRALQRQAGADVVNHFAIEADGSFTIDTALLVAKG
jgi:ubiquinone/menaquinone biosynthesis C-methylase UbiE